MSERGGGGGAGSGVVEGVKRPGRGRSRGGGGCSVCMVSGKYRSTGNYYILNSEKDIYCNRNVTHRKINSLPEFLM